MLSSFPYLWLMYLSSYDILIPELNLTSLTLLGEILSQYYCSFDEIVEK